jgi:hypothetical protein
MIHTDQNPLFLPRGKGGSHPRRDYLLEQFLELRTALAIINAIVFWVARALPPKSLSAMRPAVISLASHRFLSPTTRGTMLAALGEDAVAAHQGQIAAVQSSNITSVVLAMSTAQRLADETMRSVIGFLQANRSQMLFPFFLKCTAAARHLVSLDDAPFESVVRSLSAEGNRQPLSAIEFPCDCPKLRILLRIAGSLSVSRVEFANLLLAKNIKAVANFDPLLAAIPEITALLVPDFVTFVTAIVSAVGVPNHVLRPLLPPFCQF